MPKPSDLPDGVVAYTPRNVDKAKITVGFDSCGDEAKYLDDQDTPDPSDDVWVTVHDPRLQYFARWSKKGTNADLRAHSPSSLDANMRTLFGTGLTTDEWTWLEDAPTNYPCDE